MVKDVKEIGTIGAIILLFASYFLFDIPAYMGEKSVSAALSHHFFHANLFHLATNCYCLWMLFRRRFSVGEILTSYVISSVSYLFATAPTIGASNLLFAVMGYRADMENRLWWRNPANIVFVCVMFIYLFVPGISAITHIVSFFCAFAVAITVRLVRTISKDYGAARRR